MINSFRGLFVTAAFCTLALVGVGCGQKATTPAAEAPTADSVNTAPVAIVPTQPCEHPYYPLTPGYTIEYATVSAGSKINYTMIVESVTDSSAKVGYKFTQPVATTVYNEIGCSAGKLVAKTYLDMASAIGSIDMKIDTKSAGGEIMPANLAVGTSWTSRYETTMKPGPKFPAAVGTMVAIVDSESKVLIEESVTVPAGTFTALKVENKTTTTISMPGLPSMTPQVMTGYEWWVRGVGLVKQTTGSATAGEGVTEAVAIRKP